MRTTESTSGTTAKARRGPVALTLAALLLALPMSGLLAGTAAAAQAKGGGDKAGHSKTSSKESAKSETKPQDKSSAKTEDKSSAKTQAKSKSTSANSSKTKSSSTAKSGSCITYAFTYTNGAQDNGVFCGGNTVTRADQPGLNAVSLHISCSDTFDANGNALKSDLGGLHVKTWSIDKGNGKTCGSATTGGTTPPTGGSTNPSTCTENSFFNSASPASGSTVTVGQLLSVVYSDETPLNNGQIVGRNGVTATAPQLLIDGHAVSGLVQTPLSSGPDKYNVRLSFTVPSGLAAGVNHTFTVIAYDSDQNKKGGDCGVASWTLTVTPVVCPSGSVMVAGTCTPPVVCPVGTTMAADGKSCTPPLVCPNGAMVGPIVPGSARPGCPVLGGGGGPVTGQGTPPVSVVGNTGGPATTPSVVAARPTALPFTGDSSRLLGSSAALMLLVGAGLTIATRKPKPALALR